MPFATLMSYVKHTSQLRQKLVRSCSEHLLRPEFLPTPCIHVNITDFVCTPVHHSRNLYLMEKRARGITVSKIH